VASAEGISQHFSSGHDPEFSRPLTRDGKAMTERFHLSVVITYCAKQREGAPSAAAPSIISCAIASIVAKSFTGGRPILASTRLSSTKDRKAEAPQVMLAYHSQPSDRPLRSMALRYRMRTRCRRCGGRLAQFDLACLPSERNTLCQLRYGA
jgi:hypothetical protein